MVFELDDISKVRSYCDDYKKLDGQYVGEDFDGNMAITEVYPKYVFVKTFLRNCTREQYFNYDGTVEELYFHH